MKSIHSDQISDFVEIYSDKVELVSIDRQNYDDFQALCHQFIKSKKELNFEPQTTLLDGLQETIEWFKENKTDYLQKQNYFLNE